MFFDHVQQGTQATREHQVHCTMFAQRVGPGISTIFGVHEPICAGIAIGSTGVGVFVWGQARSIGKQGIVLGIEPHDGQAFGGAVDSVSMVARGHWHCHVAFDAS